MEGFSIRTSQDGFTSRIAAVGEIDLAVADRLWAELDQHLTPGHTVVLDCAGVAFIDSTGLRTLIKAAQKAAEVGARFELTEPTAAVRRLLDLSGMTGAFGVGLSNDLPV